MHVLRIEHPVPDFDAWKEAFDNDPVRREQWQWIARSTHYDSLHSGSSSMPTLSATRVT